MLYACEQTLLNEINRIKFNEKLKYKAYIKHTWSGSFIVCAHEHTCPFKRETHRDFSPNHSNHFECEACDHRMCAHEQTEPTNITPPKLNTLHSLFKFLSSVHFHRHFRCDIAEFTIRLHKLLLIGRIWRKAFKEDDRSLRQYDQYVHFTELSMCACRVHHRRCRSCHHTLCHSTVTDKIETNAVRNSTATVRRKDPMQWSVPPLICELWQRLRQRQRQKPHCNKKWYLL